MLLTSAVDNREKIGEIASRIGLKRQAKPIFEQTNIFELVSQSPVKLACILVDEAQFLKKQHVVELARIVDELKIPVMTFGLKNDFRNELFEGSKHLLLLADKIEEIKTICQY